MSLVSNLFLLFVAVSVLVYYIVPHKFQWLVLLCFSYIYYLAGGVRYVGFILFSTLVTWGIALAVEKAEAGGSHKSARNFVSYEFKRNGNPASIGNIVLHFPILRISSGCVLEEM